MRTLTGIVNRVRFRWQETQPPQLELCRHFFGQFFESEFVSRPGQFKALLAGVISVLASLVFIFLQSYYHKYLLLKKLDDVQPFRLAVLADVVFLISLTMVAVGLVTTLQWQSLFPDRRDYLALAALPIRMQQVFRAKFISLLAFAGLITSVFALPPSIGLPSMMHPQLFTLHHAVFGGMGVHVPGIFLACFGAGLFVFFALVALQGIVLNVLPLRISGSISLGIQAVLVLLLLALVPFAIAIPRLTESMSLRPEWAIWAPPLWFLGVHQAIVGTSDSLAIRLAWCAGSGLMLSALAAVGSYWWSYRRHRIRVLESTDSGKRKVYSLPPAIETAGMLGYGSEDSRSLGVFAFIAKTLGRSRQHRLLLVTSVGLSFAVIAESLIGAFASGNGQTLLASRLIIHPATAAAGPLALSLCILCGLRYLFRLPVEPRANWIFRLTAPGYSAPLLQGAEIFMLYCGVLAVALLSLPVEVMLLGFKRGLVLDTLTIPPALILTEVLLFPFDKIPFTSLYLPAKRLVTLTLIQYGAATVLYISLLSGILGWCSAASVRWVPAILLMTGIYLKLHSLRLETLRGLRLEFEELPEIVVQTLGLESD